MNAFEALAKLDSSNVLGIRGILYHHPHYPLTETHIKSEFDEYGISISPRMLKPDVKWEVAYVCENCSGNGIVALPNWKLPNRCNECEGDKMIWSAK